MEYLREEEIAREFPEVLILAYLDDVYLQGPQGAVEQAFNRFSERCKAIGLVMANHKCEVWSPGDPTAASELAETLGMGHAAQGLVAAGCPLGTAEFVQGHADSAA